MRTKKLSPRLLACAEFVTSKARIADIGTDHAALPIFLVNSGKCPGAIASDLRPGPLEHAKQAVFRAGLEDKIQLRLSDGFDNIAPDEFDEAVMAGMGGILITQIITRTPWLSQKDLVLQPMSDAHELRAKLCQNGFEIVREKAVSENQRVYGIMRVQYSGVCREISSAEAYIGKLLKDPGKDEIRLIEKQIASLEKQFYGQKVSGTCTPKLEQLIFNLKELLNEGKDIKK